MNSGSPSILKRIRSLDLNVDVKMGGGRERGRMVCAGVAVEMEVEEGVVFWGGVCFVDALVVVEVMGAGRGGGGGGGAVAVVGLGHKDPGIEGEGRKEVALVLTEYLSSSVSSSSVSKSKSREAQLSEVEVFVVVDAREALDGLRSCG